MAPFNAHSCALEVISACNVPFRARAALSTVTVRPSRLRFSDVMEQRIEI